MNVDAFMLANLDKISQETHDTIIVSGLLTMIADALGLRYQLNRLDAFGGIRPMHLGFCLNWGIIANLGPTEFKLLIDN